MDGCEGACHCAQEEADSRACVLLVDEYCTSKLCPYDFSELQDMGNRIRQCQTENHGATANQLFTMDRDVIGSMNILQKGVFHLLGRNLQPLYRSVEAA